MTTAGSERLAFNVDTGRILEILASEIYDSPQSVPERKRTERV